MHRLGDGGHCVALADHLARARPAEGGQEVRWRAARYRHGPCANWEALVPLRDASGLCDGINQLLRHQAPHIISGVVDLVAAIRLVRLAGELVDPRVQDEPDGVAKAVPVLYKVSSEIVE